MKSVKSIIDQATTANYSVHHKFASSQFFYASYREFAQEKDEYNSLGQSINQSLRVSILL